MRVALVGPYPPDPSRIANGVEAVIVNLVDGLVRRPGIRVDVVSCRHEVERAAVRDRDGFRLHLLPAARRLGNLTLGLLEKARVRRTLEGIGADIVHVHNHALYPYLGSSPRHPMITTVHGLVYRESRYERESLDWARRWPRILLERAVLRRQEHVIAVTDYVKQALQPLTSADIHVVENPVSSAFFEIESRTAGHRVLYAGAIKRRKNPIDLIRAIAVVRATVPTAELRIAGAAEERRYAAQVRHLVAELDLGPTVRFLGHLPETDLYEEYASCALIASASNEETSGMVFQQAMAAGKPVVGTRVGGVPHVVEDGVTGFLVEPGDIGALAERITCLLTRPRLRTRFGERARHEADQRFRPVVAAATTAQLYQRLTGTTVGAIG